MHKVIEEKRLEIAACRRHRLHRLDVFGSSARGSDFNVELSDAVFTVDFDTGYGDNGSFGLKGDLEQVLGRTVDL